MRFAAFTHLSEKQSMSARQRLDEFTAEVRLCDELGYDYFFTTEHHFTKRFSLAPSQPITLAVVAQNSQRMRFGPMVLQLPISEPLRVVEEMIILDHLSGGRLDIGLGQGVSPHEHITYGIDTHMSLDRFKEALEIVVLGLTSEGPFSYSGQFWDYVDVDLPWQPLQRPHPPIWVPTSCVERAYEYGLRGFGTGGFALVGMDRCERVFREYRRGCDEAGTPPEQRSTAYLAATLVADTDAEATALMYQHLPHQLALFEEERRRTLQMGDPSVERINLAALRRLDAMRADMDRFADELRFVHGSPDTVAAKIARLRDRLEANVFIGEFSFGELTWEQVRRSHGLFMGSVAPLLA